MNIRIPRSKPTALASALALVVLATASGGALADRKFDARRWLDRSHGHNHSYPVPGYQVRVLPRVARPIFWGGVSYGYVGGVWYAPGPAGYVVVRPPIGIVVADLPTFATAVTIAGIAYLYANGAYYREHAGGGYEVVAPPVGAPQPSLGAERAFVYPRNGQTAEQQATDEYECHRWAVEQTGFDPSSAATGQAQASAGDRRADYQRAQGACLDARGYTVR